MAFYIERLSNAPAYITNSYPTAFAIVTNHHLVY